MTTYFGLYYPYVRFRSDRWLKSTTLFWDAMGRIVPRGHDTQDESYVARELRDAGYVKDWDPSRASRDLREPLLSFLTTHGSVMSRLYGISSSTRASYPVIDPWSNVGHQLVPAHSISSSNHDALSYILSQKLDEEVIVALRDLDLARPGPGESVGMVPALATAYMTSLAEAMAPLHGAHLLADDSLHHVASAGFTFERLAFGLMVDGVTPPVRDQAEIEQLMLSLAFRTVVPANLDEISVERLISFRDTHSSERQAFQDEMSRLVLNLVTELPNVADPAVFAEHLAVEYEKAVTPKLKDLRKAMKSSAFETIDSIANVQCVVPPVISTAAIAAGITLAAPLALGAGALFGALGIWNIVRARQATRAQALADSDVRYLYSIERDLGPAALAQSMTTPVRRFEPLQVGPPPRR